MSDVDELIAFFRRCLDEDEREIIADQEIAEQPTFPYRQMLADIKAKRRILERWQSATWEERAALRWVVEQIAQPYAGREGWREEWALDTQSDGS